MSFFRGVVTVGGWTVISRIVGLARESVVAHYLGAGMMADAVFVALRFPNMFRALFAEGAFNAAFLPLFASKMEGEGKEAARKFAEQAYAALAVLLLGVIIVGEIFMPEAMKIMAPGFDSSPGKRALSIIYARIAFPYLFFIALVSLQSGVLNALGRFAAAAGTPVLLSIVSMGFIVFLGDSMPSVGHAACWGVFASGVAQFLWLAFSMRQAGMSLAARLPSWSPEVKELLIKVGPGAVGAGVYQINLWINQIIASEIGDGAIAQLNYADRLNQLPLGVVGIAIGTVLLPTLTRHLRAGEQKEAANSQNRAIEFGLLLTLPAAFAFMVIAEPIVALLFQHGHFTAEDTPHVARTLVAFAFGLPAFVLIKVLTPSYFARHDTKTPVMTAGASMVVNVALNLLFMGTLKELGLALATTIAAWFNLALLAWLLHRRSLFSLDRRAISRTLRVLLSCLGMAAILYGLTRTAGPILAQWRLPYVALLISVGGAGYGGLILLTKAMSMRELRSMIRRNAG
jgi:putative peptidoglycan lipid II flippase